MNLEADIFHNSFFNESFGGENHFSSMTKARAVFIRFHRVIVTATNTDFHIFNRVYFVELISFYITT